MVKIPELAEDGQNWKIYRAKYLEVAATENLLSIVAGWESDNGSKDWDHRNRVARMLLYITLPPLLQSRIRLLENAREVFQYLAYYFLDAEPIADPRTKKLATCTNEDKRHPSAESPTSENAATERLANAKRDEELDLPTKALNRGTKDVNDRNVGREDPRTSPEASAKGASAESAGTLVLFESAPHETQNEPQNSLPLTPRLPIDGKPGECKQEAANGVVTAECTKGTVGMAEPRETDADVDRTALLGGEPAERARGVGKGDETERDSESQLQQTNFYCKESCQRDENANDNVPKAHGLPLEGEWTVCSASGEARDPRSSANAPNATPECVHRPSESRGTEDARGVESEGCERDTSERTSADELNTLVECCQQLCMAHGDTGRGIEPADTPNESKGLVTVSIESESPDSGGIPRVHLGRTRLHGACHADRLGNGADASSCQKDGSTGWTDTLDVSNNAETAGISCDKGAGAYLGAGGAKRPVDRTDGLGDQTDVSNGQTDLPTVQTDANKPANTPDSISTPRKREKPPDSPIGPAKRRPHEPNGCSGHTDGSTARTDVQSVGNDAETTVNATEIVSTPRKKTKPPNSPISAAKWYPDEPNGCGSRADGLSVRTGVQSVGNATETAADESERVRTHRIKSRTRNSPNGRNTATPKRPRRWKRVSTGGVDAYVPRNAPVAPIEAASRIFVFGRPESGDEAIAPSVEGERAGDGDGDGNRDVGDANGTTSGGDADSTRVEAALLAAKSQYTRCSPRSRQNDLPVSSGPPI